MTLVGRVREGSYDTSSLLLARARVVHTLCYLLRHLEMVSFRLTVILVITTSPT